MKARHVLWPVILILSLLAGAWLIPASRYRMIAFLKGEPVVQGRPVGHWIDDLEGGDAARREAAARVLGGMGPRAQAVIPLLVLAVRDADGRVRRAAIEGLGRIGADAGGAVPALLQAYQDLNEKAEIRWAAVAALGKIEPGAGEAVPVMIRMMARDTASAGAGQVQMAVMEWGAAAVPALVRLLEDEDREVRAHAAVGLNWIGPGARDAVPALVRALKDDDRSVRRGAAMALEAIDPKAAAETDAE